MAATIRNNDLLLVNRDSKSYAIDGKLFKKEFGSFFVDDYDPPIIDYVIIKENINNDDTLRFQGQSFDVETTMVDEGKPPADYQLKVQVGTELWSDYAISDTIIDVEGGGVDVCETDLIQSVSGTAPSITLTFPSSNGFDCFEPGDVVQGLELKLNASEVWVADREPDKAFNGDGGTTFAQAANNTEGTIEFNPPLKITGSVTFKAMAETSVAYVELVGESGTAKLSNTGTDTTADSSDVSGQLGSYLTKVILHEDAITSGTSRLYWIKFNGQEVVLNNVYKVISKDENATPLPTITVDGGNWYGSDTSGTASGDTKLVKETPYDTKITVDSDKDLTFLGGGLVMTDGEGGTPYAQTPYKLTTTDIESVNEAKTFTMKTWSDTSSIDSIDWSSPDRVRVDNIAIGSDSGTASGSDKWVAVQLFDNDGNAVNSSSFGLNMESTDTQLLTLYGSNTGNKDWEFVKELQVKDVSLSGDKGAQHIPYRYLLAKLGTSYFGSNKWTCFSASTSLTFPGAVSTNPDLQYFKPGDKVQGVIVDSYSTYTQPGRTFPPTNLENTWTFIETVNITDGPQSNTQKGGFIYKFDSPVSNLKIGYLGSSSTMTSDGKIYGSNDGINWVSLACGPQNLGLDGSYLDSGSTPYRYFALCKLPGTENCGDATNDSDDMLNTNYGIFTSQDSVKVISTGYPDNNTMVVDGGQWGAYNQDEVWSTTATFTNFADATSGFDGDTKTFVRAGGTGQTGTIEFANSLGNGELIIYNNVDFSGDTEGYEVAVNDGAFVAWTPSSYTFNLGNVTALKKIQIKASGIPGWSAIKFANRILVDTGVVPSGDTHVEYQTNGGEGTIVSTNTDDNTLLISNTGDRDNRWIIGATDINGNAGNKAGTNFYVAGGQSVIQDAKLNCDMRIRGDVALVENLTFDEVPYLDVDKDCTIEFKPSYGGQATDVLLPYPSSIQATVRAYNTSGDDEATSTDPDGNDWLIPESVVGRSGIITDSDGAHGNEVVVSNILGLRLEDIGQRVRMCDVNGDDDEYMLSTNEILSVGKGTLTGDPPGGQGGANAGWDKVFDGTGTGMIAVGPVSGRNSISTCNFDPPITGSSIILKWGASRFSNGEIFVNGENIVEGWVAGSTNLADETELSAKFPGGISSLSVTNNPGDNSSTINWVKVDGAFVTYPPEYFFYTNGHVLTFTGELSDNPDLKYFQPGDVVQQPDVKVTSTGYPNSNMMIVDSGTWSPGDKVTFGPVFGTGELFAISGDTLTILDNNGRWIDNKNYGQEEFAVKLTTVRLFNTDPIHVDYFNNINSIVSGYQSNYVDTTRIVDVRFEEVITEGEAIRRYNTHLPDGVNLMELVDDHPEYSITDIVRVRGKYRAVHDVTDDLQGIATRISELQTP